MGDEKEVLDLFDITEEQIKKEHTKILKLLQENGEKCFGEDCKFATMEEYSVAIGTLSNCATYVAQLEQAKQVRKAQKNNIIELQKNAKEAKK